MSLEHQDHYNISGKKECWEEMKELFGEEAVAIFDCLNAYKYYYRKGNKPGNTLEQENEKLTVYLHHCADTIASATDNKQMNLPRKCYKQMKDILKNEK